MRRVVTDEMHVFFTSKTASFVSVTGNGVESPHVSRVHATARTVVRFRHLVPKAQKSESHPLSRQARSEFPKAER